VAPVQTCCAFRPITERPKTVKRVKIFFIMFRI